jgi:hypothetical protein
MADIWVERSGGGGTMSTLRSRQRGKEYLESRIWEHARLAHMTIDHISWRSLDPPQDGCELTITSSGKQRQYYLDNPTFEFQTDIDLDDLARTIVLGLHSESGLLAG